jgi:hypothetical protein
MMTCFSAGFSQQQDLSLKIEPRYVFINTSTTTSTSSLCSLKDASGSKVPLAGCQFVVYGDEQTIMEFSRGASSPPTAIGKWSGRYHGSGLQNGECGVTLTGFSDFDRPILGCRVRSAAANSSWLYESMMIYVNCEYCSVKTRTHTHTHTQVC